MGRGVLTEFYYGRKAGTFRRGEPEDVECPACLSEFVLKLSAENVRAVSSASMLGSETDVFLTGLWDRVRGKANLAAAGLSYMGYTYWAAMSTSFFEYAKKAGMIEPPPGFRYGSASGCIFAEVS